MILSQQDVRLIRQCLGYWCAYAEESEQDEVRAIKALDERLKANQVSESSLAKRVLAWCDEMDHFGCDHERNYCDALAAFFWQGDRVRNMIQDVRDIVNPPQKGATSELLSKDPP